MVVLSFLGAKAVRATQSVSRFSLFTKEKYMAVPASQLLKRHLGGLYLGYLGLCTQGGLRAPSSSSAGDKQVQRS